MNYYRIHYRDGSAGVPKVKADVVRFAETRITFYRRVGENKQIMVAAIPHEVVASVHKLDEADSHD